MAERVLKLNSLARYSKQSPKLVLEEHSHCEVPAGCGGVVLRWRNPLASTPVQFWLAANGKAKVHLDGKRLASGRPMVAPGAHVLAISVSDVRAGSGILMFAAIYDEDDMTHMGVSRRTGTKVRILSAGDGTWKYSVSQPPDDGWMLPGFDDSGWAGMVPRGLAPVTDDHQRSYREGKLIELGAEALGVPMETNQIWIRKTFALDTHE